RSRSSRSRRPPPTGSTPRWDRRRISRPGWSNLDTGTIRLTSDALRLAEGFIEVKLLGPIPVKGLAAPVDVCEAMGIGAVPTRLQAAARRGLTRFVGREAEIEQLRGAQQLAGNGHGQ